MRDKNPKKWSHTIKPNDLVMVKKHLRNTFDPKYSGTFRVLSIKSNQAHITPVVHGPISPVPLLTTHSSVKSLTDLPEVYGQ